MSVAVSRKPFSTTDFLRMAQAGIFNANERVELIDGEVLMMSPIGPGHSGIVDRLTELLGQALFGRVNIRIQSSIQLNDFTQPQPDLTVLRRRDDFYITKLPQAADVLLIIEVADSSLIFDREGKIPRYAAAGIPEAWLIDLEGEIVTQFTQPSAAGYQSAKSFVRGQNLDPSLTIGLTLSVVEILGK